MIITEKDIFLYTTKSKRSFDQYNTLYLDSMQIEKFAFHSLCFQNLEYLSLQKNNLKSLHFLCFFPNLWYLDISHNPVIIN